MDMDTAVLKAAMRRELPQLLEEEPVKESVIKATQGLYADQQKTEDRFLMMMEELRRDREENARKWEEQNKKWEENNKRFYEVHEEIMKMADKLDRKLSAIGARWGMQSKMAFRNALAGILEENFGVKVLNIREYDDTGEVFGRPDQVELDIIIKNGMLIICELKSSMSKGDMYAFERKVRFYEKRHQRKADSLIVISPMVDDKAMSVAQELGIRVYSDSTEVDSL
jgi:hypothetical protein